MLSGKSASEYLRQIQFSSIQNLSCSKVMENASSPIDKYWLLSILVGFILLTIQLNLRNSSCLQDLLDYLSRKPNIKNSLINLCILIIPSVIYSIAPSIGYFIANNGDSLKTTTGMITILIASTSAFVAISSFQQNLELRYFENIAKKYESLRSFFDREVLDKSSLDQIVITIKSIRNLKKVMPKKFLKELIILEENSAIAFIREKLGSSPLEYFTGFKTPETMDKVVDKLTDKRESSQGIAIDLTDSRNLHERLLNVMMENDKSVGTESDMFVSKVEYGKWQFKSGLNLEHIFIVLAFIYDLPLNSLNERMRTQTVNRLKFVRRGYPRLSACLYYLWDKHDDGRTFPLEIE